MSVVHHDGNKGYAVATETALRNVAGRSRDGRGRRRPAHDGGRAALPRGDRPRRRRRVLLEEGPPRPDGPAGPLARFADPLALDPGLAAPRHQRGLPGVPAGRRAPHRDPAPDQLRRRRDLRPLPDRGVEGRRGDRAPLSARGRPVDPPPLQDAGHDPAGHPVPLRAAGGDAAGRRPEARGRAKRRERRHRHPGRRARRGSARPTGSSSGARRTSRSSNAPARSAGSRRASRTRRAGRGTSRGTSSFPATSTSTTSSRRFSARTGSAGSIGRAGSSSRTGTSATRSRTTSPRFPNRRCSSA